MQAQDTALSARCKRGVALALAEGGVRRQGDVYTVKSSGRHRYTVKLDNTNGETCQCDDYRKREATCKHIVAVTVYVAKQR